MNIFFIIALIIFNISIFGAYAVGYRAGGGDLPKLPKFSLAKLKKEVTIIDENKIAIDEEEKSKYGMTKEELEKHFEGSNYDNLE